MKKRYDLEVKSKKVTSAAYNVSAKHLATICVDICGGGYTVEQTSEAIKMQRKLLDGETVEVNNCEVRITNLGEINEH